MLLWSYSKTNRQKNILYQLSIVTKLIPSLRISNCFNHFSCHFMKHPNYEAKHPSYNKQADSLSQPRYIKLPHSMQLFVVVRQSCSNMTMATKKKILLFIYLYIHIYFTK